VKPAIMHHIVRMLSALTLIGSAWVCAAGQDSGSGYSYGETTGKNETCLGCHGNASKVKSSAFIDRTQFAHTTHARIGCPSCHDAVSKSHPDGLKTPKAACRECHVDIYQDYATSIHAVKTPCAGCHNPHKVETPKEISGQEINLMCSGCHDNLKMTAKHSEWLPQAELHIRMLPCITCHTGSKNYFISMYIVKGQNGHRFGKQEVASYQELRKLAPNGKIISLIDINGDNYISLEELRIFNRKAPRNALHLQGMMTPETVTHKFEIIDNRRNCTFCHASGPDAMQTSFISLPEANGTFTRVAVEKGAVLGALYAAPDFYMMGSTKSSSLNIIGLAIICGGMILPVGHGFLRFLTRKNRNGKEHQS
jgi:predicted CXXCH cytochrome family protein